MKHLSSLLIYVGYAFLTFVSVVAAFREEDFVWRCLLVMAAVVSLVLVVLRLRGRKKIEENIQKLKDNKQDKLVFASEKTAESIVDELK